MADLEKYDDAGNRRRVAQLAERGVEVWGPERVYIGADVPLAGIEPGAVLINAALSGPDLRIGRGARIGASGHAQILNCQIGRDVELGAGFYEGATILDGAAVRGFAELRPGTLLEEQVSAAHNVAFKNTVLTATVVVGSLINYCDIFMSGGTSRSHHSEVGSGAIHFNFDPRGDKWSSLIGDARGVLLRSAPIFVGGHCGLVGPVQAGFGAVIAAGSIVRRDVEADSVYFAAAENARAGQFDPEIYTGLKRKFLVTAKLVGNLGALDAWYELVRLPFAEDHQKPLYQAARHQLQTHINERVQRLKKIVGRLDRSIEKSARGGNSQLKSFHKEHRRLIEGWPEMESLLTAAPEAPSPPAGFLKQYEKSRSAASHVEAVREAGDPGVSDWLGRIAARPAEGLAKILG